MITIVTGSPRKTAEIEKHIDGRVKYKFLTQDLDEIQGTSTEVIRRKVLDAYKIVKGPVVVEDYSLYIDILCGFPGPYIKSLLKNGELGEIVKNLSSLGKLSCSAECLYGYIDESQNYHLFSTKVHGVLVRTEESTAGLFGIDQILIQDGTDKPYYYLSETEKDEHSIRRKTIDKLVECLTKKE